MSASASHAVIVLAAGGSRRLGWPKQLLQRDGETLLHRAARLAAATMPQRLLIVLGAHRQEMRAAMTDIEAEIVINTEWESGMGGSLRLAARHLTQHSGSTLIVGCDQPALAFDHLALLLRMAATAASGCAASAHQRRPGIPAVVSSAVMAQAAHLHADRGLGAVLRALPVDSIALLEAPELARDIDDAGDLEAAMVAGLIDRMG
jgi:molybdenum cofactor cytidylyltransferase